MMGVVRNRKQRAAPRIAVLAPNQNAWAYWRSRAERWLRRRRANGTWEGGQRRLARQSGPEQSLALITPRAETISVSMVATRRGRLAHPQSQIVGRCGTAIQPFSVQIYDL